MGSLPNLHELCKQQSACLAVLPPRLSPYPERGGPAVGVGGGGATATSATAGSTAAAVVGGRAQHRRLLQTNSLCTSNFYGVIDRQADMQINEVIIVVINVVISSRPTT